MKIYIKGNTTINEESTSSKHTEHQALVCKTTKYFFLLLISIITLMRCSTSNELKVDIKTCPKQIDLVNTDFSDTGFTAYQIYHDGFCYENIETLLITKEFASGKQKVYLLDTLKLKDPNLDFYESSDNGAKLYVKLIEPDDTSEIVSGKIKAIYQNQTESNTIDFSYNLPCKKEIKVSATKLIDTMSCNTSAGPGDRYRVYIDHQGYCTQQIDSILGYGEFYSLDNYFWNSSTVIITPDRITVADSTVYHQNINFRLCITNSYSDYIDVKFYCIYKDKTKSNTTKTRIFFDYGNLKSLREKLGNLKIELVNE